MALCFLFSPRTWARFYGKIIRLVFFNTITLFKYKYVDHYSKDYKIYIFTKCKKINKIRFDNCIIYLCNEMCVKMWLEGRYLILSSVDIRRHKWHRFKKKEKERYISPYSEHFVFTQVYNMVINFFIFILTRFAVRFWTWLSSRNSYEAKWNRLSDVVHGKYVGSRTTYTYMYTQTRFIPYVLNITFFSYYFGFNLLWVEKKQYVVRKP